MGDGGVGHGRPIRGWRFARFGRGWGLPVFSRFFEPPNFDRAARFWGWDFRRRLGGGRHLQRRAACRLGMGFLCWVRGGLAGGGRGAVDCGVGASSMGAVVSRLSGRRGGGSLGLGGWSGAGRWFAAGGVGVIALGASRSGGGLARGGRGVATGARWVHLLAGSGWRGLFGGAGGGGGSLVWRLGGGLPGVLSAVLLYGGGDPSGRLRGSSRIPGYGR